MINDVEYNIYIYTHMCNVYIYMTIEGSHSQMALIQVSETL